MTTEMTMKKALGKNIDDLTWTDEQIKDFQDLVGKDPVKALRLLEWRDREIANAIANEWVRAPRVVDNCSYVWEFYHAPEQLQIMCNGGDVDYVAIASKKTFMPLKLEELGCCSNTHFYTDAEGNVTELEGYHDHIEIPRPDLKCPDYPNCHIVISNHA